MHPQEWSSRQLPDMSMKIFFLMVSSTVFLLSLLDFGIVHFLRQSTFASRPLSQTSTAANHFKPLWTVHFHTWLPTFIPLKFKVWTVQSNSLGTFTLTQDRSFWLKTVHLHSRTSTLDGTTMKFCFETSLWTLQIKNVNGLDFLLDFCFFL